MDCRQSSENVELPQNKADEDFVTVTRQSRKRKQTEESMETNNAAIKRPHLPPISGEKLLVNHVVFLITRWLHLRRRKEKYQRCVYGTSSAHALKT